MPHWHTKVMASMRLLLTYSHCDAIVFAKELAVMARQKTFNFRLDEQDRARLDSIAEHYSASAATAIRILLKRETERLEAKKAKKEAGQ